jgi:hypothetical protein
MVGPCGLEPQTSTVSTPASLIVALAYWPLAVGVVLVELAERGREIGLRDAAKGVRGERRLVAVRVGDDDIDFSIGELKSKAPPFKKRRTGHPKFNYKARATRLSISRQPPE